MERKTSLFGYAFRYGLIFSVLFAGMILLARITRDSSFANQPLSTDFVALGLFLIAPVYYIGFNFVAKEQRGLTRSEGIWLSLLLGCTGLVTIFLALIASETLLSKSQRDWTELFTSFQTVPAFAFFWIAATTILALPIGVLLWLSSRRATAKLDQYTTDTFS
jgi:uncharacterized membrane protein